MFNKRIATGTEPIEFGHVTLQQGKRSDLELFKEAIRDGQTDQELLNSFSTEAIKYHKAINFVRNAFVKDRTTKPLVKVFWGDSGSGKSHTAIQEAKALGEYYIKTSSTDKWWDGYTGQQNVIIEEFYGNVPWSMFLNLLDNIPMKVEVKGSIVTFQATHIWITSNSHPLKWYDFDNKHFMVPKALLRRIDVLAHFQGDYNEKNVTITYEKNIEELDIPMRSLSLIEHRPGKVDNDIVKPTSTNLTSNTTCVHEWDTDETYEHIGNIQTSITTQWCKHCGTINDVTVI